MMRRVLAIASATLLLAAAAAYATTISAEIGSEVIVAGASSSPEGLPRGGGPIRVNTTVRVRDKSGSQPPALQTMTFLFDGSGSLHTHGVPVCTAAKLADTTTAEARKRCAGALVGKGTGKARIALPAQTPTTVTFPLSLFNGPPANGMPTLIGHFRETVPTAKTVLIPIEIERVHRGRYSYRVEIQVPPIADGFGSPTLADATLGRTFVRAGKKIGFVNARCRGGRLQLQGVLLFANGDRFPATLTSACHVRG
jgi:hypothetical protein